MYEISYVIKKLLIILKKDDIYSLFCIVDNNDIVFISKYLDSIIYNINTKNIGLISIDIFKKNIDEIKNNNKILLNNKDDIYINDNYERIAINKILCWMEKYNYVDNEGLFQEKWISSTHFRNYPKLWLSTMFVFNIIRKYSEYDLNHLSNLVDSYNSYKKSLDEKRFKNLKKFYYKIYKNKYEIYKKNTDEIIYNTLFFIENNVDIKIIFNIQLFNDNIDYYYSDSEFDYEDINNIELKRKCLIQYLNIIIYIIDNIMYEKGCRKYEKIDNLSNNKISSNIINKLFILYFICATFILYFFYNKLKILYHIPIFTKH